MRLKTILLFAVIGVVVSAPMLFDKANQMGSLNGNANASNQWQTPGVSQPWQLNNPLATEPPRKKSFLSRLFGSGDNDTAKQNTNSPFHFAGSQASPGGYNSVPGQNASASTPMMVPPATFSQPVYQPFASLNEFLRFDVSPSWVKQRWPRVSSFPAEDKLTAMRVALVSGPRPVDIHGSLTYYFDNYQRVQRIGFKGWTGDAGELARYVERAGFNRRNSNGAGLFTKSSWGKTKGALRLDHSAVSSQDLPNEQLMVLFEFANPKGSIGISQQTKSILEAMENR